MKEFEWSRRAWGLTLGTALLGAMLAGCDSNNDLAVAPPPDPAPSVTVDYFKDAPDTLTWGPAVTVTAFAPAQRSWQYMLREELLPGPGNNHPQSAANAIKNGATCVSCHNGSTAPDAAALGASLVSKDAEPVPGKVGSRDIQVQAAYTANKFYLKTTWKTQNPRPGASHDLLTYVVDAAGQGAWQTTGIKKPNTLLNDYDVYSSEDRISMFFMPINVSTADTTIGAPDFHQVGCWASCHNNTNDMTKADPTEDVKKYLLNSRVGGSVTDITGRVPALELAALKAAGQFNEMWVFLGGRAAAVQSSVDGRMLEARGADGPTTVFSLNTVTNGNPTWMYDKAVTGFSVVSREQFAKDLGNTLPALIIDGPGKNAVPFDPTEMLPGGAFLPNRVLKPVTSLVANGGSVNDVKTYSKWEDGTWTVIFERDRETLNADDHALNPNQQNYSFAFAVYDDHTSGRWHFVSFPVTLGDSTTANIKAEYNN